MNIIKKIIYFPIRFYKHLFFSGLEFMLVLGGGRTVDQALEEFEEVMEMGFIDGYRQMFINNRKFHNY